MRTYFPKGKDLKNYERKWFVVDATDMVLGRLASFIAGILSGKNKPEYTPFLDMGDHVIVINADKVKLTGSKLDDKIYYRHTGYIGHLRQVRPKDLLQKHPERLVEYAVKGMLPRNSLGRKMYKKLKVYASPEHPHQAQKPVRVEVPFRRN
jgi:large subunit ribosomal protein L13